MRKIRIDKDTIINSNVTKWIIEKHQSEKSRISELRRYYNNNNSSIINREYNDPNKPSNRLAHPFASYITNMAVGYFLGNPVSYNSENEELLLRLNDIFKYNDEADSNTTLAKHSSIGGYAVELLYIDENSQPRFTAFAGDEVVIVYDNTLEENILCAIRYFEEEVIGEDKTKTTINVYTKDTIQTYELKDDEISFIEEIPHYFQDVPVVVYLNNDEMYGDFEKVKSLIDAYDQVQSDTANDFEYFTNALLVISGVLMDSEDNDFKNNRVLNFTGSEGKAEYLIKNINDSALENFKNRLVEDIHKFSQIPNLTDEQFAGNVSGESMKYKLMGLENITGIKEAKFKKGLMRRIELLCNFLNIATNNLMLYTDVQPIFTRNKPKNEVELANMVKGLYGILSDETLISILPFIDNAREEIEKRNSEKENTLDYQDLGVEDEE